MRSDHASFFTLAARARHGGELRRAVVVHDLERGREPGVEAGRA